MAKYTSGRQKNLKVGISSYSENLTSLEVIGKVGIGTTNADGRSLYVIGNAEIVGILTAQSLYGEFTGGSISGTNIVGTSLSISGISTFSNGPVLIGGNLGIGTTNPTSKLHVVGDTYISGIVTASQLSTGVSGTGININTDTISGPATLTIDPAAVGDNTGAVRIKGDLYVDGTQFIVNSTTIELADLNVGIATTVGTNDLLDGAGIGIGSANIRKTILWNHTAQALTSSEDWNLASGKQYEIGGTPVLSSTQLTVTNINATGVTTVGFLTATNLYVTGVGTFLSSGLQIRNPANTFGYTIAGGAIAADRTLTLPVVTANTGIAVTGLSQTFTAVQTFNSGLTVSSGAFTHSVTTANFIAQTYTTGTVTIGGPSQTGAIVLGQSTVSQTLNLSTGVSGVGTTKTINLGTGGASGSFTQINIGPGPSAGVGTVVINSGTKLGIGSLSPTSALDVLGDVKVSNLVTTQNINVTGIGTIVTLNSTNVTLTNINSSGITTVGFLTATNVSVSGVTTSSAYYIDTSQVISSARQLQNIASLDATTTATIETAIQQAPNDFTSLNISGISTLQSTTLIGGGTSTGTASQRLQVTGGAYVSTQLGVGVTNPASNTQVAIAGTLGIDAVGGAGTRTLLSSSSSGFVLNHNDNSNIDFRVLSTTKLQYQYSPNFWTIPAGILFLVGTATSTGTASQPLQVSGGAYVSGNLGIGTTNPLAKLHVSTGTLPSSLGSLPTGTRIISDVDSGSNYLTFRNTSNNTTYSGLLFQDDNIGGYVVQRSAGDSNIDFDSLLYGAVQDHVFKTNNIGISGAGTEVVRIKQSGSVGIGTTNPTSKLTVQGDGRFSGVITATTFIGNLTGIAASATQLVTPRTFQITGDIVGSPISFDGTGNVSIAATIQPDSVALGSDTTGDYVQSITGTSNQISVSVTSGEGSTPVISIPNQFTIPQDVTVTRDLQVNRNLNVTGNITLGGTTAFLNVQELKIADPDIVLGVRTDGSGNDISNDTTSNHGGIAVASTEGNPLVSLNIAGIETLPPTYKKIMWFKSGTFAGLGTDAWLINYAVGVGSTQFPSGTRLAAGSVQFTENDLAVVRNINASGIITATTGNLTTVNITTGNIVSGIITTISGTNLNYSGIGTIATLNSTGANLTTANITAGNIVTGVVTTISGTNLNYSGIGTIATLNSTGANLTTANITTGNIVSGIITTINGTDLNYSGIGTIATLTSTNATLTNINSSGISTFTNGPILVGTSTATGTASQRLQVTGGAYIAGDASGNALGIGETNPQYPLDIKLSSGTNSVMVNIQPSTTTRSAGIRYINAGSGNFFTGLTNSTGGLGGLSGFTPYAAVVGLTIGTSPLLLITNNTERVRVFSTGEVGIGTTSITGTASQLLQVNSGAYIGGNLGIGTTNPTAKLQVSDGDVRIDRGSTTNNLLRSLTIGGARNSVNGNFAAVNFSNYDSSGAATEYNGVRLIAQTPATGQNGGLLAIYTTPSGSTTAVERVKVFDTGEVGIGTTSITGTASQRLQVTGGAYVSGSIGIGTTNPQFKLDVNGDINFNGTFYQNGSQFVASRWDSGTGDNIYRLNGNVGVGTTNPQGTFQVGTAITMYGSTETVSATKFLGSALSIAGISTFTNGPVLIGGGTSTGTASQSLQITGISSNVYIGGGLGVGVTNNTTTGNIVVSGTVTANSDAKLKTNVKTIENALDKVLSLRGVEYDRIDTGDHQIGLIAQEVEKIIPQVVYPKQPAPDYETKSVSYQNIVGLLIEAIKEQDKRILELERKLGEN